MSSAPLLTSVPRSTGVATTRPATSADTSACSSAVSVPVAATNREIGFSMTAAVVALTVRASLEAAALASLLTTARQPAATRAKRTARVDKRIEPSSLSQAGPEFVNVGVTRYCDFSTRAILPLQRRWCNRLQTAVNCFRIAPGRSEGSSATLRQRASSIGASEVSDWRTRPSVMWAPTLVLLMVVAAAAAPEDPRLVTAMKQQD